MNFDTYDRRGCCYFCGHGLYKKDYDGEGVGELNKALTPELA